MYGVNDGETLVDEFHFEEDPVTVYLIENKSGVFSARFFKDGNMVLEIPFRKLAGNKSEAQNKFQSLTFMLLDA